MLGKHEVPSLSRRDDRGTNAPAQISRAPHEKREDASSRVRDPSYRLVPRRVPREPSSADTLSRSETRRVTVVGSDAKPSTLFILQFIIWLARGGKIKIYIPERTDVSKAQEEMPIIVVARSDERLKVQARDGAEK